MLFEEDDFVLKPISILNEEFSMAIHPTAPSPVRMRPNAIPTQFKQYAESVGGVGDSPGYASGGGTIFNRTQFIDSYERALDLYTKNFDEFCKISKIYGWQDFLFQYVMQLKDIKLFKIHSYASIGKYLTLRDLKLLQDLKNQN